MHQREVKKFAPGESLIYGVSPLERAARPGADLEALKKDVFGHFIKTENIAVDASGSDALTQELSEFVDCVRTGNQPCVTGQQAYDAMIVADEIMKQINAHQWDGNQYGAIGPYPSRTEPMRKAG